MSSKKSDLVIVYHRQPYEEVMENGKLVRRENKSPNLIRELLFAYLPAKQRGEIAAEAEAQAQPA